MYAVVEIGGHQHKVSKGDVIYVNRIKEEEDKPVTFDRVLMIGGKDVKVGTPEVEGAQVKAKVVSHLRDDKIIVFKKKRRKGYRKKQGHRQNLTQLEIQTISS